MLMELPSWKCWNGSSAVSEVRTEKREDIPKKGKLIAEA